MNTEPTNNSVSDSEKEYIKRKKEEIEEPILRGYDVNQINYSFIENENKFDIQTNLELYKKCVLNIYYNHQLKNIVIYDNNNNDNDNKLFPEYELIYSNDDFKSSKDLFDNLLKDTFIDIKEASERITKIVRKF